MLQVCIIAPGYAVDGELLIDDVHRFILLCSKKFSKFVFLLDRSISRRFSFWAESSAQRLIRMKMFESRVLKHVTLYSSYNPIRIPRDCRPLWRCLLPKLFQSITKSSFHSQPNATLYRQASWNHHLAFPLDSSLKIDFPEFSQLPPTGSSNI